MRETWQDCSVTKNLHEIRELNFLIFYFLCKEMLEVFIRVHNSGMSKIAINFVMGFVLKSILSIRYVLLLYPHCRGRPEEESERRWSIESSR